MPSLTIFTPVYNRAYIISHLYQSLCRQTSKDFEWLVVDDGSTDNIEELINGFISENKIKIRFFKQENGGKHRAINKGVLEAKGDFFFIVDSDDYVTDDAVEWVNQTAELIKNNNEFGGLSGIRITPDGKKIGGGTDFGNIDANAIDIRIKHSITGDLAEVFKTKVLREYSFPEFNDEKFCPEALVWNRIARKYKIHYCHKGIYVCEYLPDGLTAKITSLRHRSPIASSVYYSEFTRLDIPFAQKIKGAINFWRFYEPQTRPHIKPINPLLNLFGYIPGKLMRLKDKRAGQF